MIKQGNASSNALAVLHEIRNALQNLKDTGENWTIFLNKMPLTPTDRELISDTLGRGSVTVVSKGGTQPAEWIESSIAGVWLGVYYDSKGGPLLETIEVTLYPTFAAAQPEDVAEGITTLIARIQEVGNRE
jgi:hypothetical protein